MGTKSGDWPWSALGIAATADKDAIHAAYAAKRAELDAQAMRISAFAKLTEAREKALFIASEMQRELARSGITPVEREPTVDAPTLPKGDPPEPEPEPEPIITHSVPKVGRLSEQEWEDSGGYVTDVDREMEVLTSSKGGDYDKSGHWSSGAPTPFMKRNGLDKHWLFWVLGLTFLIAMCSWGEDDPPPRTSQVVDATADTSTAPTPSQVAIDLARTEAMIDTLFGPDWDYSQVVDSDSAFALELAKSASPNDESFADARAFLRTEMLKAQSSATKEQALAIAELRLAWLTTAQEMGAGACREVTSTLFDNGIPEMRDDWVQFEQSLAASLLQEGRFDLRPSNSRAELLPDWVISDAAERYDIGVLTIRNALNDFANPNRCAIEIALLQAMLARPDDVTPGILAGI